MNDVDYTQRTADGPGDDEAARLVKALRRVPGLEFWDELNDPQKLKRFTDEMRGALSGYDTTAEEDARLRQEAPEKPFSSDEFWNCDEPQQYTRRKL